MITVKSVTITPHYVGGYALSANVEVRVNVKGTVFVREHKIGIPATVGGDNLSELFAAVERYVKENDE